MVNSPLTRLQFSSFAGIEQSTLICRIDVVQLPEAFSRVGVDSLQDCAENVFDFDFGGETQALSTTTIVRNDSNMFGTGNLTSDEYVVLERKIMHRESRKNVRICRFNYFLLQWMYNL
jgi:hypothetical protein